MIPELPLESPVLVVGVAVAVFMAAPLLLRRLGIPGSVGILLAGTLLGPHGLGVIERSEPIVLLGTVGLLYLMFVAALEIDLGGLTEKPGPTVVFGLLSFGIPLLAGTAAATWAFGFPLDPALLLASVISSHTILAFPVIEKLGLGKSRAVTAAISGTLITDTAALLVLAWVTDVHGAGAGGGALVRLLGSLILLAAGAWMVVPRLARAFFRWLEAESYFEFLFAMTILFLGASLAEAAGIEPLVGAFLAGLGLNRRISTPSTLQNRIDFTGNAIFIPFFLLSVGMLVDPAAFVGDPRAWLVAGVVIGVMFVSKLAAAWIGGTAFGFDSAEMGTMFGLSTGQAAAALAITLVGYDQGIFDLSVVNGVVIMVAVAAVVSPVLSERFGEELARRERDRDLSEEALRRILVPLFGAESGVDRLLDLAMVLRGADGEEPIRVVRIVRARSPATAGVEAAEATEGARRVGAGEPEEAGSQAEEAVAEAEAGLEELEELAASAEVAVDTQTRVDEDRVHGVLRAVEENRITTIVTEWAAPSRFGSGMLGAPTGDLVRRTDELLLAARLREPLEAVDRLVAVVPASLLSLPSAPEALRALRSVGAGMDVPQIYLAMDGGEERLGSLLGRTPPEAPFETVGVPGPEGSPGTWEAGLPGEAKVKPGDMLVVALSRPGTRGWSSDLEHLFSLPSALDADNAILLFVSEDPRRYPARRFLRFT